MKHLSDMAVTKFAKDISTGVNWYFNETFAAFLKEHFAELLCDKSFVVHFAGEAKEVFMTRDLQIQLRNCKEEL